MLKLKVDRRKYLFLRASESLFQLIKSMGKAEKGYFKKYASMHTIGEKNNYVKLFDAIEKQAAKSDVYNEDKIKKQFDDKFIRQLPVVKNYLYKVILESLQLFNSEDGTETQVRDLTEQYDILYGKVLFKQAGELLKKAKTIAIENEMFPELINILSREKILARIIMEPNEFELASKRIYEEELRVLEKMKNVTDYSEFRSQLIKFVSIFGSGFVRNEDEKKQLHDFLAHPLLESEERAITSRTKRFFYQYRANLYLYLGDIETSYAYQMKHLRLSEEGAEKNLRKLYLMTALNNVLTLQIRLKKYDECEETLLKIKNFEKIYNTILNENEKAFRLYSVIATEVPLRMVKHEYELGLESVKALEEPLNKYDMMLNAGWRMVCYYLLGSYYFLLEDFVKSQKWLAKIIQISSTDFYSDYQCYARIMNLIVHYELKNFEHLDYVMKSTYYFLRKRNKIYKYEQIIIKFMKRSLRANSERALLELFAEMKFELEVISKDDYEKNAFDAFNIIPWLQSKIEKKTMCDVLAQLA
jgi:hypothetical protein